MVSNIADTHAFPYSAVARVAVTIGGSASHGSGVLIAPDELLTAASVVWTPGVGAASSIQVSPDSNGTDSPFGSAGVLDYHYITIAERAGGIPTTTAHEANFALLHLDHSISAAATMTPVVNAPGGDVHIVGYPDYADGASMIETIDFITQLTTASFYPERNDTGAGTSGGPLWVPTASGAAVIGVVSGSGTGSGLSTTMLNLINSWVAADHAGGLSGAIAVAQPLTHAITTEAAPPGANPAEASLFDMFSYRNNNTDVASSSIDPLVHFLNYGWHENRAPNRLFDVSYYLSHNPDVAASHMDPLLHYALFGWQEGRDPSASFSTNHYLAVNQDVKLAGMDPLQHYLLYGVTEGRST